MMSNLPDKFWLLARRHYGTFLFVLFAGLLLFSPDAKAWLLKQLMYTGLYNAHINNEKPKQLTTYNFTYTDTNNRVYHTRSLRGKVIFINFWASWCPPCRAEFPSVQSLYNQLKGDSNVVFLTINEDDGNLAGKRYLLKQGYTVPIFKTASAVPDAIYTGTLPTTVILDKAGKIRYRHAGLARYDTQDFILQIQQLTRE